MKNTTILIILFLFLCMSLSCGPAFWNNFAEGFASGLNSSTTSQNDGVYKVCIKKIDDNLYKDVNSGVLIETKFCFLYAYYTNAILFYKPYSLDNKLVIDDDVCEVVAVYKAD